VTIEPDQESRRRVVHVLASVVAMLALVWAVWASGRVALSRLLVKYGTTVADVAVLDAAIGLTPTDAETHYARAEVSNFVGQPAEALKEIELAVSLRPRDYVLWLELGMTRDQLGDTAGALSAFNESVRLAPYYSQPHWQRGNLLFRVGRYDEAFVDLRNAAASNPDLVPNFVDLAWGASRRDAAVTEQLFQPRTDSAHLALARFFATHGRPAEAVTQFKLAHDTSDQMQSELIRQLVGAGGFKQAYELWSSGPGSGAGSKATIYDGGFEAALRVDEVGFGWRTSHEPGVSLSVDANQPQNGARSLRVDFSGNSNPGTQIVSQLILAEPAARYKLNFAVRTQKIVTGGPPIIVVSEATGDRRQLGRSVSLPQETSGWQPFAFEFATGPACEAIVISLQRENCTTSPCPIFGSLNLDSFSLERMK
jgi:Tetratricopeptide repeat